MTRPWLDLHPKILAAIVTLVLVLGVVWLAREVTGIDITEQVGEWIVGVLPVIAGYLMPGDDKPVS